MIASILIFIFILISFFLRIRAQYLSPYDFIGIELNVCSIQIIFMEVISIEFYMNLMYSFTRVSYFHMQVKLTKYM